MLTQEQVQEVKKLVGNIRKWRVEYYNGTPSVPDQVYDGAELRLNELIPNHPVLSEVGAPPDSGFQKYNYVSDGVGEMLSLSKVHSANEVINFASGRRYVAMVKLDGLSLRAVYKDGKLRLAHTRGNSSVGEVVTNNFYFVAGAIPTKFPKAPTFSVRGEVVMLYKDFEALNEEKKARGEELFSNPRNAASGSLKQKDFMETAKRKLSFLAYKLEVPGFKFETKTQMLNALESMGFKTPRIKEPKALVGISECIDYAAAVRPNLPVMIDGLVFELDDISLHEQLGCTGHHPRYAVAYKFPSDKGTTRLINKEWDVTRTRRVVPVGNIEPIEIGGAVCTRITLNNAKWVRTYKIADGEDIVIERANDVIPHFVEMVRDLDEITAPLSIPENCPACQAALVESGVDLVCPNRQCSGAAIRLIEHYVSKPVVNMEGVGEALIAQLVTAGFIKTPADLYTLTKEQLISLDRSGERKSEKILESIQKSKIQSKEMFLLSLGIESLGKDISAKIADYVDLSTMKTTTDLLKIEGISYLTATAVETGLRDSQWLADELLKHVSIQKKEKIVLSNVLADQTFCVSGSVEFSFGGTKYDDKDRIKELIETHGGRCVTGVSKKVTVLIAGPGSGNKSDKAREYGIKIVDGESFVQMLQRLDNQQNDTKLFA